MCIGVGWRGLIPSWGGCKEKVGMKTTTSCQRFMGRAVVKGREVGKGRSRCLSMQ